MDSQTTAALRRWIDLLNTVQTDQNMARCAGEEAGIDDLEFIASMAHDDVDRIEDYLDRRSHVN